MTQKQQIRLQNSIDFWLSRALTADRIGDRNMNIKYTARAIAFAINLSVPSLPMPADPITQTITIPPILPAQGVILADANFVSTLAKVELEVAHLRVSDAQSAQQASDLQQRLTTAGKKMLASKKVAKSGFQSKIDEIEALAKKVDARIEAAKDHLKGLLTAWDQEQQRIAREAEIVRQKELARLEALRLQEKAETRRKAEEVARIAAEAAAKAETEKARVAGLPPPEAMEFIDFPDDTPPPKTATEIAIETVRHAPAVVVQRPMGVTFRVSLRHKVESVAKLPEPFVIRTANDAAIRAAYCNQWKDGEPLPECPGVAFSIDRTPVSTGRDQF